MYDLQFFKSRICVWHYIWKIRSQVGFWCVTYRFQVQSAFQLIFDIFLRSFKSFRHFCSRYSTCALKFSLLLNIISKYFACWTTGIVWPSIFISGSRWYVLLLQTIFVSENWKPFSLVYFFILLRQFCICLSSVGVFGDEYVMAKSSTYRNFSIPVLINSVMLLILRINNVTDKILPWGTPVSCLYMSEVMFLWHTIKVRWERKFLMNMAMFPLIPVLWRSFRIPYFQLYHMLFWDQKRLKLCGGF